MLKKIRALQKSANYLMKFIKFKQNSNDTISDQIMLVISQAIKRKACLLV